MTTKNRTALELAAAAAAVLVLAACSSSGGHKVSSSTSTTEVSSGASTTVTGSGSSTSAGAVTTTVPLSPALPAPATSGALVISATIPIPLGVGTPVVAEAPDGAVFVAESNTPVWVVDGDQPAVLAEHVTGGAQELAADAANLYAAHFTAAATTVLGFDRTSGAQTHQWALPAVKSANIDDNQLVTLVVAGGSLWTTVVVGNDIDIYRIDPTSAASPSLVATSVGGAASGAAIGPDGSAYYTGPGAHLTRRTPAGQVTVGPALADAPNSEGGGVQNIDTVAAGLLWVDEPAGQGLDAGYSTFNPVTLAPVGGPFSGNLTESGITDTLAGPLDLTGGNAVSACPPQGSLSVSCVFRFSTTATLSDLTRVGDADALVGPYPAVVTTNAAGTGIQLDRLS